MGKTSERASYIMGAVADKICYHFSVVQYFPVREVIKKAGNVNRPGPTDANLLKSTFLTFIFNLYCPTTYIEVLCFLFQR